MRQKSRLSRKPRFFRESWVSPAVFGLAVWLGFPTAPAFGDLAGLIAGLDRGGENWRMVLTDSPAGSIHQSELAFTDSQVTGAIGADAGLVLPNGRKVAIGTEKKGDGTQDEDRINRQDKKRRVMAVEKALPPKDFSAGSVLQRSSSLLSPDLEGDKPGSFARPKFGGKELQIASAFYRKAPKPSDDSVPTLLADLVTNDKADVLATAYAPATPDYARQSPFDSILANPADDGRFVPKIGPQDHAWAASVLPPSVFSSDEQQCLASGIYFEARGESVKGQAAVAQVILNRVRNPAYPKTICGVVYQNEDWRNRCQFSFACDRIKDKVNSPEHWKIAREVAMAVTAGKIWLPEVGSATHYHAIYVWPRWARSMEKVGRIGLHVFYRTYGGGWS